MPESYRLFATTAKGMEALLADEIRALGIPILKTERAGVIFEGTLEDAYRVCLWSRIANRVLLPLKTFHAPDPDKLYGGVRSIRWTDHLTPKNTLSVDFSAALPATNLNEGDARPPFKGRITHTHYAALKVKDAIVDQFRTIQGSRPSVDSARPDVRVNVYLDRDEQATVSLDLSGDSLHRRGYRERGAPAPLKENLGAAILMLAGWPGPQPHAFQDPMCGSGTLPIEAALMAAGIAPGLAREYYGFLGWQGHVPAIWKRLIAEAKDKMVRDPKKLPKIAGFDQDFRAVNVALGNVEKAGLRGMVHIEKRELSACEPIAEKGILAVNPPYGERMGEEEALKPLYGLLGDTFKKKFKNWEAYVFTGSSDLAKCVGLKASRRFVLYNGAIECRLLKYELY